MKTKINYRKIYEEHYGKIPKDEDGRSYQIHHIDGNRENNDITNLIALSIHEHYEIHYWQEDAGACYLIGRKMKMPVTELAEHARQQQYQRIANGTHNLVGDKNPVHEKVANGTHNFLGGEIARKSNDDRIKNGTHNFLGDNNPSHERLKNGTHNFQDVEQIKRTAVIVKKIQNDRVKNGTHHLLGGTLQRATVASGKHNLVNGVTCRDRDGNVVQISKTKYWSQVGDRDNWEYVSINCLEGKKRKIIKEKQND